MYTKPTMYYNYDTLLICDQSLRNLTINYPTEKVASLCQ